MRSIEEILDRPLSAEEGLLAAFVQRGRTALDNDPDHLLHRSLEGAGRGGAHYAFADFLNREELVVFTLEVRVPLTRVNTFRSPQLTLLGTEPPFAAIMTGPSYWSWTPRGTAFALRHSSFPPLPRHDPKTFETTLAYCRYYLD